MVDRLPVGLRLLGAEGRGWSCAVVDGVGGPELRCTSSERVAAGGSWPTLEVTAAIERSGLLTNTAEVRGRLRDPDPSNDTASDPSTPCPGSSPW